MQTDINWWPTVDISEPPQGVAVVSVNYNTRRLIAQLLWSLYRFGGEDLRLVVIIDNGSTDGSLALLQAAAQAGLCELIANPHNQGHGPSLSQALSHLASRYAQHDEPRSWVWLLDSDCMLARPQAAGQAIEVLLQAGAGLAGEDYWNEWHAEMRFLGCSLLLDPAQVWQAAMGGFEDGGDPVGAFEHACRLRGVKACPFPFTRDGWIIHLGRGTLAEVWRRDEQAHPLYAWAQDHHAAHFQQVPGASQRYAALLAEFEHQAPELSADQLIRACQG